MILEDGTVFKGYSFGAQKSANGEAVFSTSMVGYPEALTDPSYRGQIVCLTYPLVGNYGVPDYEIKSEGLPEFYESDHIQVRGLVVHGVCEKPSHYQSVRNLDEWLRSENIPGIYGVDTRRLTRVLRERGVMLSEIVTDDVNGKFSMKIDDPNKSNLVREVSVRRSITYCEGREDRVALIDCGVKFSIIRNLLKRNFAVTRMPYDVKASDVMEAEPAGIVVSNGPGDPKTCKSAIKTIQELIETGMPVLGICLGNQLIALAEGADTYKMKYGHRSQNQPVLDVESGRCYITTQNHGYAVDKESLERAGLGVWFVNANDRSIEGIKHPKKPCWGVQWHPEASPGPIDTEFIFDFFAEVVHDAAA
ncbi:MAG TPA: glutamine-hydrolyzing carbamoyl-phosphate synthase small subunit [Candidatus Bathyarchaeia archaeon]|nr:glutamine-hydrolyzing carbamoyl-phosphate synthase small subunit [Candidatus Bathyarchaeia archaeon]